MKLSELAFRVAHAQMKYGNDVEVVVQYDDIIEYEDDGYVDIDQVTVTAPIDRARTYNTADIVDNDFDIETEKVFVIEV